MKMDIMLHKLQELSRFIGNTPLRPLEYSHAGLYAKLEYNNFSGSSKDRAAYSIIYNGIRSGAITEDTTIVASSSGNLAIACATICKLLRLRFIPVIDPNINEDYEALLDLLSYRVVKVTTRDITGGYLLTRIEKVNELCAAISPSFCADQYGDPNNYKGYYGMGEEIIRSFDRLDYIFIAVSSSGAVTGISNSVKKERPDVKIMAVDVEGSVIFGREPRKRHVSGIGASQVPPILKNALIDDVLYVSQEDIIKGCLDLLEEQAIFAGASSGAVYFAARSYLNGCHKKQCPVALLIFPDKGTAYIDTIYNPQWAKELSKQSNEPELIK